MRVSVRGRVPTLRGRITLAYTLALTIALVVFAIGTLMTVDTVQRRNAEAELRAVADDEASNLAYSASSQTITSSGATRFAAVAGSRVSSAILGEDGRMLVASAARVPDVIARAAADVQQDSMTTLYDNGVPLRVIFVPMTDDGTRGATIAVWRDTSAIWRVDRNLGIAFAIAIPLFAGLAGVAGSAIARRNLAPLEDIANAAASIDASDLSARLASPETNELRLLADALNRTLARLESAFERERRFTNDASHEFRTPLAIILAETELALTGERKAMEYRHALEAIAVEADSMETLTRNLLATARTPAGNATTGNPIDLAEIVRVAVGRTALLCSKKNLNVVIGGSDGILVCGKFSDIEQALLTVVHNAIKHTPPFGTIRVEVLGIDAHASVRISDSGSGFTQAALEHAFDRFWHENAAAGIDGDAGHGLGLSIARSIVERYGGTVQVANGSGSGGVVTFRFSRAIAEGRGLA